MDRVELLTVIHDHTGQLSHESEQLEDFLQQGISEIKKGEARLQQQFAKLDKIEPPLDEITLHDLRSPLNLIIGFSEVLLDEIESPLSPDQRVALEALLKAGMDLSMYIDEHLDTHTRYIR